MKLENLERYTPVIETMCDISYATVETDSKGSFIDFASALLLYNNLQKENEALKTRIKEFEDREEDAMYEAKERDTPD